MENAVRTNSNQRPEITLTEVIYSDEALIDSLDSQLRKGTVETEQMDHTKHHSTAMGGGAGFLTFANASGTHERGVSETSSRIIRPHDFKVQTLIAELGLEVQTAIDDDDVGPDGRLGIVYGEAQLFSMGRLKSEIDLAANAGLLDHLQSPMRGRQGRNAWMNGKPILEVFSYMIEFLPETPSVVLSLSHGERVLLPVVQKNLRYPLDVLFEEFPGGFLGDWVVFGIMRPANNSASQPLTTDSDLKPLEAAINVERSIQSVVDAAGYPKKRMTPIHMYKSLGSYELA